MDISRREAAWTCLEKSTQGEAAWVQAFRRGCLSKALNDKDIAYSYLKALSRRQPAFQVPDTAPHAAGAHEDDQVEDASMSPSEVDELEWDLPDHVSPVILEDMTRPPPVDADDTDVAHFTIREFLSLILHTSDWPASIRLRVVGGELLRTFCQSLVSLEKRYLVNLHKSHAYANSRVKKQDASSAENDPPPPKTAPSILKSNDDEPKSSKRGKARFNKQDVMETSQDKIGASTVEGAETTQIVPDDAPQESIERKESEKVEYPKSFQTDPEWIYEKLGLEIVYFEKCDKSNTPFVKQVLTSACYEELPEPKALVRPVKREPLSHKLHRVSNVRLPSYENVDVQEKIRSLEEELENLRVNQERLEEEAKAQALVDKSKAVTGKENKGKEAATDSRGKELERVKGGSIEKDIAMSVPDVEDIAENPYLQLVGDKSDIASAEPAVFKVKDVGKKISDERRLSRAPSTKAVVGESEVDLKPDPDPSRPSVEGGSHKHSPSAYSQSYSGSETSELPTLMQVSGSLSGTFSSLSSAWEPEGDNSKDKDGRVCYQQLELTRQELYVSSLYAPRERNRWTAADRFARARRDKAKQQAQMASRALELAKQRSEVDLSSRFKHLKRKKEAEQRIATRPKVKKFLGPSSAAPKSQRSKQPACPENISLKEEPKITSQMPPPRQRQGSRLLPTLDAKEPLPPIPGSSPSRKDEEGQEITQGLLTMVQQQIKQEKDSLWEKYRKDQDICEMESALKNDLESGILHRMPTINFHPSYKKYTEVSQSKEKGKGKADKNKSHNKTNDKNANSDMGTHLQNIATNAKQKQFSAYSLFLSLGGQKTELTHPEVKSSIIQNSFCVDEHGLSPDRQTNPTVRRIGFTNPAHLISYLASVCKAVRGKLPIAPWRRVKPGTTPVRSRKHSSNIANTEGSTNRLLGRGLSHRRGSDINNSGINSGAWRGASTRVVSLKYSDRNSSNSRRDTVGSVYRASQHKANINTSSASETTMMEERIPEIEEATAMGEEASEVIAQEEGGGEGAEEAEDELEDKRRRHTVALTVSEILERDLQCYGQACACEECADQEEYLAHLKPARQPLTQVTGCPPILGRLRRDFRFLDAATHNADTTNKPDISGRVHLPIRHPVMSIDELGDCMLEAMSHVMVRKEILSSSQGFTFVTLTFTKRLK